MQCTSEQPLGFDLQLGVIDTSELLVVVKYSAPLNNHFGFDLQLSVIDTSDLLVVCKCSAPLNNHLGLIRC